MSKAQTLATTVSTGNVLADGTVAYSEVSGTPVIGTDIQAYDADTVKYDDELTRPDIRPSLNLDFANTKRLDSRITFTRSTTASYYDGVTTAKAEENLLTYSQDFNNSAWIKPFVTIASNDTTAPDSTVTADKVTQTDVNNPSLRQAATFAGVYQYSVYVKYIDIQWLRLLVGSSSVWFDILNGTVGVVASGYSASIQSAGNGWYRCIVETSDINLSGFCYNIGADADGAGGEVLGSYYLWGAQLEQRSAVTAYTPTTTQPITNYIPVLQTAASGVARFDHNPTTGESLGLLVEEQRTNVLTYSEQFDNAAWDKTNTSTTANTIVAPDGTLTGDRLVENTADAGHAISENYTVAASTNYTASIFAKAGERDFIALRTEGAGALNSGAVTFFDLQNGSVGTTGAGQTASIQAVGNGWYRCSISFVSAGSSGTLQMRYHVALANNVQIYTGDGYSGIYIWGAQLEAGAFPTSYIPTTTAQVTRSADAASMTGANFSSWYRADEGTLFADSERNSANSVAFAPFAIGENSNNFVTTQFLSTALVGGSGSWGGRVRAIGDNPFASIPSSPAVVTNIAKIALSINGTAYALSVNGEAIATYGPSGIMPSMTQARIGYPFTTATVGSGWIRKLAYYPKRLTNAQLQALTS